MKLLQYDYEGKRYLGYLDKEEAKVFPLAKEGNLDAYRAEDLMVAKIRAYVEDPAALAADVERARAGEGESLPLEQVKQLAPIVRSPHDVICVGINYMAHVKESTEGLKDDALSKPPASTIYFSKRVGSMAGPGEDIVNPWEQEGHLDYEAELAVIIGKGGRDIPKEEVEEHIFGYSVFNDISGRETQKERIQWYMGKSVDTYSCMGPVIVTREELPFPLDLQVQSLVNGEIRQDSPTTLLMRDVPTLISEISSYFTLEPGDIIATGTPSGVAMGMEDPKWLKPGDVVECRVEGVGSLINHVR